MSFRHKAIFQSASQASDYIEKWHLTKTIDYRQQLCPIFDVGLWPLLVRIKFQPNDYNNHKKKKIHWLPSLSLVSNCVCIRIQLCFCRCFFFTSLHRKKKLEQMFDSSNDQNTNKPTQLVPERSRYNGQREKWKQQHCGGVQKFHNITPYKNEPICCVSCTHQHFFFAVIVTFYCERATTMSLWWSSPFFLSFLSLWVFFSRMKISDSFFWTIICALIFTWINQCISDPQNSDRWLVNTSFVVHLCNFHRREPFFRLVFINSHRF